MREEKKKREGGMGGDRKEIGESGKEKKKLEREEDVRRKDGG